MRLGGRSDTRLSKRGGRLASEVDRDQSGGPSFGRI